MLSDYLAFASLIISLVSGGFTLFYARTQHKLNKVQLAEKEREAAERKVVTLHAELVKGPLSWTVRTTNIGKGTAFAVTVGCEQVEGIGALLEDQDIGHITPVAELRSGSSFDILATNWYGLRGPQAIQYNWNDEDGKFCTTKIKVLVE
ncbi:MAG: hypothetical protein JSS14_02345 [Proteobacteria bacterium]|nr:hypothetical protein [Pseudomonadota bacterium]